MATEPERRPELKDLEALLRSSEERPLADFLEEVHPADLAEWMEELDEAEALRVLGALHGENRTELLSFADDSVRESLLPHLSAKELTNIVEAMPADEVVDLLALTDEETTNQVLRKVDFERAAGLRELASYNADTAGGLMTSEYVAVGEEAHVSDAIKEIKSEEGPAGEEEVGVFVIDPAGQPVGYVSDRELLTTPIHTPIRDIMETDLISVPANADQEDVAHLFRKYSLAALPVLDPEGVLIGVISSEDIHDVLEDEAEEDILRIVGTSPREQTKLPVLVRVRHRLPLQALTVVGGLVTAYLLGRAFPDGGDTTDILRYLPIIIGLAGNVGIQSSTVLVRAYATGELSAERENSVLASEILVGCLIGLVCGTATFLVASYMEGSGPAPNYPFGFAIGGAIAVSVSWAALLGCLVPFTCERIGIDPAVVAGPFLITLSDISGAAIFVFVATSLGLSG